MMDMKELSSIYGPNYAYSLVNKMRGRRDETFSLHAQNHAERMQHHAPY